MNKELSTIYLRVQANEVEDKQVDFHIQADVEASVPVLKETVYQILKSLSEGDVGSLYAVARGVHKFLDEELKGKV